MTGTSQYSAELVRRCEVRGVCVATTRTAAALGEAIDAGIVTLDQVLDLVRSCSDANQLGETMSMLAATASVRGAHDARV